MAGVSNVIKNNIVSQVPYLITFEYETDAAKPTITLSDTWTYLNNQTKSLPLYGATNINVEFNGKNADWEYGTVTVAGTVSGGDTSTVTFTAADAAKFSAGSYYRGKTSGEWLYLETIDATTGVAHFRRALFGTTITTIAATDIFIQLNKIVVTVPQTGGENDSGFGTIWANPLMGPSAVGYYKA